MSTWATGRRRPVSCRGAVRCSLQRASPESGQRVRSVNQTDGLGSCLPDRERTGKISVTWKSASCSAPCGRPWPLPVTMKAGTWTPPSQLCQYHRTVRLLRSGPFCSAPSDGCELAVNLMPRCGQLEPPICGAVGRPRSTAVGSVLDALGTGSAPLSEWKKKTVSLFHSGQGGQAR